ncbi:MAG: hypothetical protein K2H75_05265 [Muribaculaceae bacterium]|nr:hypothetical protein [Muribaculaceae bacterium]
MSFRLEPHISPILRRLSRLLPLLVAAFICLVLTLCQHSKSAYNPMLEQRILSLDTESAVAASDSLDASDERNAALAAFCRGKMAYENANPKRATAELKMAESLIDSAEISPLSFGISHYLFYVNYYYGDIRTAHRYADRTRHIASILKDTLKLYNAITVQAAALLEINRKREAIDTIMRVLDYASALPLRQQARMYNNIGYMFQDSDINISRLYYEKAIACEPTQQWLISPLYMRVKDVWLPPTLFGVKLCLRTATLCVCIYLLTCTIHVARLVIIKEPVLPLTRL